MKNVFIIDGLRTPIGGVGQSLKEVSPIDLGAAVIKALIKKNKVKKSLVGEVIIGNVVSAGLGQNPARQCSIGAKLPMEIPAFTVDKVCGSGLKSVILASQAILCGDSNVIIAGGIESASQSPYIFPRNTKLNELNKEDFRDSLINDGLWCSLNDAHMGEIAEYTAKRFRIGKHEQNTYAFLSHKKACRAQKEGFFQKEIVPIKMNGKGVLDIDEKPRKNISLKRLNSLPSAFKPKGSVTAGNSSAPADGAAALILSSEKAIRNKKLKPVAQILGYATVATKADLVFTAPALAIKKCLKASSLKMSDVDIFEVNEAFAIQALLTVKLAKLDIKRLNIFGGAVALGHPLGVSGARGLVTLINALKVRKKKIGVTSVCLGGGCAVSLAIRIV